MDFAEKFQQALSYGDFLDRHASPDQRQQWDDFHRSIQLTTAQRDLLAGFTRQQRVLCLAGSWCGDCVRQCPIFDHFQMIPAEKILGTLQKPYVSTIPRWGCTACEMHYGTLYLQHLRRAARAGKSQIV